MQNSRQCSRGDHRSGDVTKFLQTVRATSGVDEAWITDENKVFVKLKNYQIICLPELNMESLLSQLQSMEGMRPRSFSDASQRQGQPQNLCYRERASSDVSSMAKRNDHLNDKIHKELSDGALNYSPHHDSQISKIFHSRLPGISTCEKRSDSFQTLTKHERNSQSISRLSKETDALASDVSTNSSIRDLYTKLKKGFLSPLSIARHKELSHSSPDMHNSGSDDKLRVTDNFKNGENTDTNFFDRESIPRPNFWGRRSSSVEVAACSSNLKEYARRRSIDSGKQALLSLEDIKNMKFPSNKKSRGKSTPFRSRIFGTQNDASPKLKRRQIGESLAGKDVHSGSEQVTPNGSCRSSPCGTSELSGSQLFLHRPASSGSEKDSVNDSMEEKQLEGYVVVDPALDVEENRQNCYVENDEDSSPPESGEKNAEKSETSDKRIMDLFRKFIPLITRGKTKKHVRNKNHKLSRRMSMDSLLTSGPIQHIDPKKEKWERVIKIAQTKDSRAICIRGADTLGGLPDCDNFLVRDATKEQSDNSAYHRRMSCPIIFEDDEIDDSDSAGCSPNPGSSLPNTGNLPPPFSVSTPSEEIVPELIYKEQEVDQLSLDEESKENDSEMVGDNISPLSELYGVTFIVPKGGLVKKTHCDINANSSIDYRNGNKSHTPSALSSSLLSSSSSTEPEREEQQRPRRQIYPPKRKTYKKRSSPDVQADTTAVTARRLTTGHTVHNRLKPKAAEQKTLIKLISRQRSGTSSTLSLSSCEEESDSSEYLTDVSSSPHPDCGLSLSMEN